MKTINLHVSDELFLKLFILTCDCDKSFAEIISSMLEKELSKKDFNRIITANKDADWFGNITDIIKGYYDEF